MKNSLISKTLLPAMSIALVMLAANAWGAAQYYSTTAGALNWANTGGSSVWGSASGGPYSSAWTSGNTAVFEGIGGSVTVSGAVTAGLGTSSAGGIGFTADGYTLSASSARTITIGSSAAAGYITVASGKTATIGDNVKVAKGSTSGEVDLYGGGTLVVGSGTVNGGAILDGTASANTSFIGGGSTLRIKTGGTVNIGNSYVVATDASACNLIVEGGALNLSGTASSLIVGNAGSATYSASAGMTAGSITFTNPANTTGLRFGGGSTAAATHVTGKFDLDGGTLTVNKIFMGGSYTSGATYDASFNFNGGTLKALANNTLFMDAFSVIGGAGVAGRANVRNGGAIIDLNGKNVTINQPLAHSIIGGDAATDGGLTLNNTGSAATLTLGGANTYTGPTKINAGTLALGASGSIATSTNISIAPGATFDSSLIVSLTLSTTNKFTVTGSSSASASLKGGSTGVDLNSRPANLNFTPTAFLGDASHPALVVTAGTLSIGGSTITVTNLGASPLGAGDYTLIDVSGSGAVTGTPVLDASAGVGAGVGMAVGTTASLQYNGSALVLHVVSSLTVTTTTISLNSPWTSTSTYGDALSFHVTVSGSSPTGTVTVKDGGVSGVLLGSGTLSGGAADIVLSPLNSLSAVTHGNIVAVYDGDLSNQGSVSPALASQTVNPKALTVTGAFGIGKCFDGSTAASFSGTLTGIVGTDVVTLIGTGSFDNSGPGAGINITAGGTLGGASATNYSLSQPTGLSAAIVTSAIWTSLTNGSWDVYTNWANNIIGNASGNTADFSTLNLTNDVTVSLNSARTIGNLIFGDTDTNTPAGWSVNNGGVAGNILTLAGTTPTVMVHALGTNKSVTISAVIGGSSGLTKTGNGTLALTGVNTFTGGLFVSNGIASYNADAALGAVPGSATPGNIVLDGGTLSQAGANQTITTFRGTELGANGGTLANVGGGNMTYGGIIAGSGALTVNLVSAGSGVLLQAQNTYTGGSTFIGSASGNVYCVASTVGDPGSLVSGPFGTGTVTFNGPGTRSSISADTTVNNAIVFAADATFQTLASEKTLTLGGPVTLSSNRSLTVNVGATVAGKSLTFTNAIGDGGNNYSLTKAGTGLMILSGASTYGGGTIVSAGKLQVDNTTGSGTGSGAVTVNGSGTLSGVGIISGSVTIASSGILSPGNGIGTMTVGGLTLTNGVVANFELTPGSGTPNDTVTVSTSGGLTLNGGTINLYEVGTTTSPTVDGTYNLIAYSGTLNGSVNNLSIGNPAAGKTYLISADGSNVKVTIGTAPALNYWGVDADGSWSTAANWSLATVPSGQFAAASFGGPGSPVSFTLPHAVTLDGSQTLGSLTFDSAQSFSINQGTGGSLIMDNGSAPGAVTETSGSHTIAAPVSLNSYGATLSVNANTTLSLNGVISGSGGIAKSGSGTNLLAGANTYAGSTVVSAGTLLVGNNSALGSTAGTTIINTGTSSGAACVELANGVVVAGETIAVNGYGQNVRGSLQVPVGAAAEWAGPVILGVNAAADTRIGAQTNGTLKITGSIRDGALVNLAISAEPSGGKVIVAGTANTYSGESQIVRGTLQLGANNALPVASVLAVDTASSTGDDGAFDLNGFNQELAGIRRAFSGGNFPITNSSAALATLTVNNTNAYTFTPPIAGNLALFKSGSATLTLSGANTYAGNTTVQAGTLAIAQATLATNSTIAVSNGALLTLNFTLTNQVAGIVLGGASVAAGVVCNSNSYPAFIAGPGSLLIQSTVPPTLTVTDLGGSSLQFSWTGSGILQSQTNNLNTGLNTNWGDYPGGGASPVTVPIDPSKGSVFFRVKQ